MRGRLDDQAQQLTRSLLCVTSPPTSYSTADHRRSLDQSARAPEQVQIAPSRALAAEARPPHASAAVRPRHIRGVDGAVAPRPPGLDFVPP